MRRRVVPCDTVLQIPSPPMTPGPDAVVDYLSLDGVPSSVRRARRFVRDALRDVDREGRDTAVLLASELVTNAVLHAGTPVELGVVVDDDLALVCVADGSDDSAAIVAQGHGVDRYGGRGLALVDGLSDRWGTETHAGGKTVWFTLSVAELTPAG
jgi:anti-sigma regulatory factor (Ser/Thr protein kinase)